MEIVDQLRAHIRKDIANGRELSDEDSLLAAGLLDSLAIVKLVTYIENQFDIEIDDSEFDPENFESISAIAKMIERTRG